MRYHIYWQDKILLKDLDEEEFRNIWSKMHWVYNKELNYENSVNDLFQNYKYIDITKNYKIIKAIKCY